jgi:RNA polymerase sigma factor (TIGR02999 family)
VYRALRDGDREALDRLVPRLYVELQRIAHRIRRRRDPDGTLPTTALVNELYVKLVDQGAIDVENRSHFLALAARVMHHIVIDRARHRAAEKRGGDRRRVSLAVADPDPTGAPIEDLVSLDRALGRLRSLDDRLFRVVECRFFAGLTVPETAEALNMSPRTVDRIWRRARLWLYREMHAA